MFHCDVARKPDHFFVLAWLGLVLRSLLSCFVFCAGVGLVSYQIFMFYPHFAFFHLKLEKLLRIYKLKKNRFRMANRGDDDRLENCQQRARVDARARRARPAKQNVNESRVFDLRFGI